MTEGAARPHSGPATRLGLLALALALAAAAGICGCRAMRIRTDADPSGGQASAQPPAGLRPAQVPQFVVFGFDDNGMSGRPGSRTSGGLRFVNDLFRGRQNPKGAGNPRTFDGTPALFSLYVVTRYIERADADEPEHVKREWRAALEAGHEVGLHTHSHPHGATFRSDEWAAEIDACARWLERPFDEERAADPATGIGLSRAQMAGFRAPFVELGPSLFPALRARGIRYDCSVEEGFADGTDARAFPWPYPVAAGYGGGAAAGELWEIPAYALVVPPDAECERYGVAPGLRERLHARKFYFDPAEGKITGFDWNLWVEFRMSREEVLATFRYTLDQRLAGNRAPLTFGAHSDIYADQYETDLPASAEERRRALREILDLALGRPEVRVVAARQLLEWLRQPGPL